MQCLNCCCLFCIIGTEFCLMQWPLLLSWSPPCSFYKAIWFIAAFSRGRVSGLELADGWILIPFHSDWSRKRYELLEQPDQLLELWLGMYFSVLCVQQAWSPGVYKVYEKAVPRIADRRQYRKMETVGVLGDFIRFDTFVYISLSYFKLGWSLSYLQLQLFNWVGDSVTLKQLRPG